MAAVLERSIDHAPTESEFRLKSFRLGRRRPGTATSESAFPPKSFTPMERSIDHLPTESGAGGPGAVRSADFERSLPAIASMQLDAIENRSQVADGAR